MNIDSAADDDVLLVEAIVCFTAASAELNRRETFYCRQRLIWREHVIQLRRENNIFRTYRMDEEHFVTLLVSLRPWLSVDGVMSTRRTGKAPISEEVVLHCVVRYLAGGSYLDIREVAHISVASFYRCVHKGILAILSSRSLAILLPKSQEQIEDAASEFKRCSTEGVVDGCIGCIDGMLVRVKTPSRSQTGNVRAYFSGHYQSMGLNIQTVCDSKCRFIFLAVAAPGGSSDVRALARTSMASYIDSLGSGRYVIGDGAYVPSEHLLTPFGGARKLDRARDTYDFYISQLRLKIEQAFGTKWRRLRSPLQMNLRNASKVVLAIARLHNFCSDIPETIPSQTPDTQSSLQYLPSIPTYERSISIAGVSNLRERLVAFIRDAGLSRLHRNLIRQSK